jgi:hypothetical protein
MIVSNHLEKTERRYCIPINAIHRFAREILPINAYGVTHHLVASCGIDSARLSASFTAGYSASNHTSFSRNRSISLPPSAALWRLSVRFVRPYVHSLRHHVL